MSQARNDCPHPQWDWRQHSSRSLCYRDDGPDMARAAVLRLALDTLRGLGESNAGSCDLDGPIWAIIDLSARPEETRAACLWFRLAAQCGEDDETKRMLCFEAFSKVERTVWGQLSKLEAMTRQRTDVQKPTQLDVSPKSRFRITR